MKIRKKKQLNNKGFSLVELLVALAVSAVVITIIGAFVSQGTGFYSEQGNSVNLQNELQEVSNVVTETLQEATMLDISQGTDNVMVYTGEYHVVNGVSVFETNKGASRLMYWDGAGIYLVDKPVFDSNADNQGNRYSKYVSTLSIRINDKCKVGAGVYSQPLMLDVTINVSNRGITRAETKTITLRNTIEKLVFDGNTYKLASGKRLILDE